MSDVYIYPTKSGSGGSGPEEDIHYAPRAIRLYGISVLAFAVALAITFLIFFGFVSTIKPMEEGQQIPAGKEVVVTENEVIQFVLGVKPPYWPSYILYGFIAGLVIAAIYNYFIVKRLNIYGLESSVD
jgi:hypothetical protein